jgi:hypothetical protein
MADLQDKRNNQLEKQKEAVEPLIDGRAPSCVLSHRRETRIVFHPALSN